jgi:hypothetical protein
MKHPRHTYGGFVPAISEQGVTVQEAYVIPDILDHATQGELQRYENNYRALNLITTALGRNVYDRVAHLETAHDVWLKLCNTYECSSEIKSSRRDTYNRQY